MSFIEQLKKRFQDFITETRETFQFHRAIDKKIEQLPTSQNIDDYYYDPSREAWIPKAQMGIIPTERIDQNIQNLLNIAKPDIIYSFPLADSAYKSLDFETFDNYYNRLTVVCKNERNSTYHYEVWIDIFENLEAVSAVVVDKLIQTSDVGIRVISFEPVKNPNVYITNLTGSTIEVQVILSYSDVSSSINNTLFGRIGKSTNETYDFYYSQRYFNGAIVFLYHENSTLNCQIKIISHSEQAGSYDVIDETITTGLTYYQKYYFEPINHLYLYLKNNSSTKYLYYKVFLFFSKSLNPNHTHIESDITDLVHNAQQIKGKVIDDFGLSDDMILKFDSVSDNWKCESESSIWNHDGTQVFNGSASTSWTDLDLSEYVGSNYALVFIKIKDITSGGDIYYFRQNGETDEFVTDNQSGTHVVDLYNSTIGAGYIIVETDNNGIIEWKSNGTREVQITLMGYIK